MRADSGPVAPLEQRCVLPGWWKIEGYEVRRVSPQRWAVSFDGPVLASRRTLAEAREWIREKVAP